MLDGESAEAAEFHSFAAGKREGYLLEDRGHDGLHILAA